MRQRKDMECGKDLSPRQAWASYRREMHEELVDSVTEPRIRDGVDLPQDEAGPG